MALKLRNWAFPVSGFYINFNSVGMGMLRALLREISVFFLIVTFILLNIKAKQLKKSLYFG